MKTLTPRQAAKQFLDGAGYTHRVSRRRARLMLSGSMPLDTMAVIALADACGVPYFDMKGLIEQFIHNPVGGQL